MPSSIILINKKTPINLLTETRLELEDKKTGVTYTIIVNKKDMDGSPGKNYSLADIMKELAKRGMIQDAIGNYDVVKKELPLDNLKSNGCLVLIFVYPFILLIRFVIWAIRTLRKTE